MSGRLEVLETILTKLSAVGSVSIREQMVEIVTLCRWVSDTVRVLRVELRACMRLQDGSADCCRVAVVRVTGSERNPLQVFEWR